MRNVMLIITLMLAVSLVGCGDDPVSPQEPETMIRLKTGGGLNNGAFVSFLALSKDVNFGELPGDIFEYDRYDADWFIDGAETPFTTEYKPFTLPVGRYYYLLKTSGVALMSTLDVQAGQQTGLIYGQNGNLRMDLEVP